MLRGGRFVLFVIAVVVSSFAAASAVARPDVAVRPVIAQPVATPAAPVAGERFAVSFVVSRSDTRAPVRAGSMDCSPSIAGSVVQHTDSFRNGIARLALTVPPGTGGKKLIVAVTVRALGQTARRVATFAVRAAPVPALSIGDVKLDEGAAGTSVFSFPVTLSFASKLPVSVQFATGDGSASAPADYVTTSGGLTFAPGETQKTVLVQVVGDAVFEPDETFTVGLSSPVHATLATAVGTAVVVGDELRMISPARDAVVPQNVLSTGCYADPNRGAGFTITFAWKLELQQDADAVEILVQRRGAVYPVMHERIPASVSSVTQRSCAFVSDSNLGGWVWALRVHDTRGDAGPWLESPFSFAPCRLANGRGCSAPG